MKGETMHENIKEAEKWLMRTRKLVNSTSKENIEFVTKRIELLEWLINKAKEATK